MQDALAERYGFDAATVAGSCCQALLIALHAVSDGIAKKEGDRIRVALPTYVCPEVLGVVETFGGEAVLFDIDESYQLDVSDQRLSQCDVAIAPALFGRPPDARAFAGFPGAVIADWAQYAPPAPSLSHDSFDIAVLSFEATKVLSAGEGGAVLTRGRALTESARRQKRLHDSALKVNLFPLSDLQATLAQSQLNRLDDMLARRREIADRYIKAIGRSENNQNFPPFRFIVRTCDANAKMAAFKAKGVLAKRPVDPLLHHVRKTPQSFPVADALFQETVSIPCYPALTDDEVSRVAEVMQEVFS